ncbi:MAG: hypothetical protein J6A73_00805 [Lachnospiraceae bacterium]|nr:hypothetical protein [Lachnospiraceae bacterium]
MSLLLIALGIFCSIVLINRPKKNPCYVGQIVDISARPRSHGKHSTRHPLIVRVIINNQPIVTSTLSTVNCFWGINGILESKKKEYVGRIVHVYFDHQAPRRSIIKECQGKNIAGIITLFVVGLMSMFAEFILLLTLIYFISQKM